MTIEEARAKYPALMTYIEDRSGVTGAAKWDRLREDERAAHAGDLADVATQLAQAQADYGQYPYNSAMGEFLGLPLGANTEPAFGYYMAGKVLDHHRLGEATREAERLIAEGKPLYIVAARCKTTRKPVRLHTFKGPEQVKIIGASVQVSNGKRRGTLTSNWSIETAIVRAAEALRTGRPYGEEAA
jgi:hypothetical protein